jgi:hypothetical protein
MRHFNTGSVCNVIDITLYKFNYYDNLIWTKCLNQINFVRINESSILMTPDQLRSLFEHNFKRELIKTRSIAFELAHKEANSIYFINELLNDFNKLKWIKLTQSKTRKFSRVVDFKDQKQLSFSFKILKITLRLSEILQLDEIKLINPILKKYNLIKNKPYNTVRLSDVLKSFDNCLNTEDVTDDQADALSIVMDVIDYKCEMDNPEVILVTDW